MAAHDVVLSVRMTQVLVDKLDKASDELGNNLRLFPGGPPSRNQMIRTALVRGVDAMRKEEDDAELQAVLDHLGMTADEFFESLDLRVNQVIKKRKQ
tara:strand:- start:6288 stop:6578 length:291 start_codon:yes stop_codon:yes gene_type:complete